MGGAVTNHQRPVTIDAIDAWAGCPFFPVLFFCPILLRAPFVRVRRRSAQAVIHPCQEQPGEEAYQGNAPYCNSAMSTKSGRVPSTSSRTVPILSLHAANPPDQTPLVARHAGLLTELTCVGANPSRRSPATMPRPRLSCSYPSIRLPHPTYLHVCVDDYDIRRSCT